MTDNAIFDRAMDKIRDEMAARGATEAVREVGNMMTFALRACPAIAEKLLDAKKTLKGAYNALEASAESHKARTYCMGDDEAVRLALEYYGIDDETAGPIFERLERLRRAAMAGEMGDVEEGTGNREQGTGIAGETGETAEVPAEAPAAKPFIDDTDALLEGL